MTVNLLIEHFEFSVYYYYMLLLCFILCFSCILWVFIKRICFYLGETLGVPIHVFGAETHMTAIVGMALGKKPIQHPVAQQSTTANFLLPGAQVMWLNTIYLQLQSFKCQYSRAAWVSHKPTAECQMILVVTAVRDDGVCSGEQLELWNLCKPFAPVST